MVIRPPVGWRALFVDTSDAGQTKKAFLDLESSHFGGNVLICLSAVEMYGTDMLLFPSRGGDVR